jgi:hypothetical protein
MMAAGDAQRVWFPEMLEALARTWSASMTWDELADFCGHMTEQRRALRESRGIEPSRTRCPKCGAISQADIPGVTIRSALFALKKTGAIDDAQFEELDKSWRKHKAKNLLDAYGRRTAPSRDADGSASCC